MQFTAGALQCPVQKDGQGIDEPVVLFQCLQIQRRVSVRIRFLRVEIDVRSMVPVLDKYAVQRNLIDIFKTLQGKFFNGAGFSVAKRIGITVEKNKSLLSLINPHSRGPVAIKTDLGFFLFKFDFTQ